MGKTITAEFDNRRDAEMSVERLVQEQGVERTSVFIAAAGSDNSAGVKPSGADVESGHQHMEADGDPKLSGKISVSVDFDDDDAAAEARSAFTEFGASSVSEK
jgi:hypothetical protein